MSLCNIFFLFLGHCASQGSILASTASASTTTMAKPPKEFADESTTSSSAEDIANNSQENNVSSLSRNSGCEVKLIVYRNASKICHTILSVRKPIFHFVLSLSFSLINECSGLSRHRPGHSLGKKIK